LRYEPDFRELGFGAWEGRHWADLYAEVGEPLLAFQAQPGFNPAPGGEHYADFESRIFAAWTRLLQTARGGHWLLIAHAGVIRAILRLLLGFPARRLFAIAVPYAGLTRIEQQGDSLPRLVFHRGGG
jgi:broad specificity phosphatase PhoE